MRFVILALAACLMGCQTIPHHRVITRPYIEHKALYEIPGWQAEQNKAIYSAEEVAEYFEYFLDRWQARGLPGNTARIKNFFNKIELHWQQTKFVNPEGDDGLLLGYMINRRFKDKVSVFVYDCSQRVDPKLGDTALGHELIHVALLAVVGNTERKHFMAPNSNWSITFQDLEDEVNAKFR